MRIVPVTLKFSSGGSCKRYLASGMVGRVFVHCVGHTHSYALHNAFNEFTRGNDVD